MRIKSPAFKIYVFVLAAALLVSAGTKRSLSAPFIYYIFISCSVSHRVFLARARASHENNIPLKKGIHRWMGLYINFQFVLTLL